MSVSDYIHPGWGESARRIRQFFREVSDSKGPRGVESHQLWCDSDKILEDGRCEGCNAMRQPVVHRPYVTRGEIPAIMQKPRQIEAARSYREDVVRSQHLQSEMERKLAAAQRRGEEMRREIDRIKVRTQHETERLKARVTPSQPCTRCGARTNNVSKFCHRCKVRMTAEHEKTRLLESHSHVAMYTGDGKVISHGLDSVQCKTCSAIYYLPGPCPWCQLALKPLDSGNDT